MDRTLLRSPLAWSLVIANLFAIAAVIWASVSREPTETPVFRLVPASFAALPGWAGNDLQAAVEAFRRSCGAMAKLPPAKAMGWDGYAGRVGQWLPACSALPPGTAPAATLSAYFERWFTPVAVDQAAHFTGYYEPQLSGSRTQSSRFRVPVYGRPSDLVTADLGAFRHAFVGEHIAGRLESAKLVPYPDRADIDAHGLATAPTLLYADDPVSVFFLQIQGSGLVRLPDGQIIRLAYAGKNGRPYTPIGRILIEQGALDRKAVSLQSIRAWLETHAAQAKSVMEADQSYVFFEIAALGDPSLGSPGTEGVPLTAGASLAVDPRLHPMGAPIYVATTTPDADPAKPDHVFQRLLIAQDTGGAIKGAARGDIFFGAGAKAEAIAGRLNAHGEFLVLLPKAAAGALGNGKEFPDAPR